MSTNIFGPYKNWQEAVPCGGGGNYFQGPDGFWYCTYFGNDDQSPWREKPGMVRIDFERTAASRSPTSSRRSFCNQARRRTGARRRIPCRDRQKF
jgi:hypothetical protein